MKRLILTVFTLIIPVSVLAQNSALAEYMCNKYNGELNYSIAPPGIEERFTSDSYNLYTCMINNKNNQSIYKRTNHLLSTNKTMKKTMDWKDVSFLGKDYKLISIRKSSNYFSIYVPLKKADRVYILVYNKYYPDRINLKNLDMKDQREIISYSQN